MFCTRPRNYSWFNLASQLLKRSLFPKSQFIGTEKHFYSSRNFELNFGQYSKRESLHWSRNSITLVRTYCAEATKTCTQLSSDDIASNKQPKVRTKRRQGATEVNGNKQCNTPSAKKSPRVRITLDEKIDNTSQDIDSPKTKRSSLNKRESKAKTKQVTSGVSNSPKSSTEEKSSYNPLFPLFPFEGQPSELASYCPLEDEFRSYSESTDYSVKRVDSSHGRFYHIISSKESFCFPSVTTVLDATKPKAMFYRLQNWKKSMIKEHGKTEFKKISANTLQSGTKFHKQLESRLLAGADKEVISIKPWKQNKNTRSHNVMEAHKDNGMQYNTNVLIPKKHSESLAHTQNEELVVDHYTSQPILPTDLLPLAEPVGDKSQVKTVFSSPTAHDEMELPANTTITGNLANLKPGSSTLSVIDSKSKMNAVHVTGFSTISEQEEEVEGGGVNARSELNMSVPDGKRSGYMDSVEHVLKDISHVRALESVVTHFELGYTGTFDCLAEYKGELCVIDWKTSTRPRPNLSDCFLFPLQAAAYAGAINQDFHYPFKVNSALIVIAYASGDPAHAHFLSPALISIYWEQWVERLEQYQTQFASDLSELAI